MTNTLRFRCLALIVLAIGLLVLPSASDAQSEIDSDRESTTDLSAAELARQLEDGDLQQRRDAAWALAAMGPDADEAVPALTAALAERDTQVINGVLLALGRIGRPAASAVETIFDVLDSNDDQRRYRAAYAMGRTCSPDCPLLQEGLASDSRRLRVATVEAIGWVTEPAEHLVLGVIECLNDRDEDVIKAAQRTLPKLGAPAVPGLCQALNRSDATFQRRVAEVLASIGPAASTANGQLMELSNSDDSSLRAACVRTLSETGRDETQVRERLVRALGDADDQVVAAAVTAIIRCGDVAHSALPQLIQKLDAAPEVASLVGVALGRLGADAVPAVPGMLNKLTDENQQVIFNTIGALGPTAIDSIMDATSEGIITIDQASDMIRRMGPQAAEKLEPGLIDQRSNVRSVAAQALGSLRQDSETANQLVRLLDDGDVVVRVAAANGLAQLKAEAQGAIPKLLEASRDPDAIVRRQVVLALVAINATDSRVSQSVLAAIDDRDATVRQRGIAALAQLKEPPGNAADVLARALVDPDAAVRQKAAEAIAGDAGLTNQLGDQLIAALSDENEPVVLAAAQALVKLDSLDVDAVEKLIGLLQRQSEPIRIASINALAVGGDTARQAEEQLVAFQSDESSQVRLAVLRALADLSVDDQQRLQRLMPGLHDVDWTVRREVVGDLADMGEEAEAAIPTLLTMMQDSDDSDAVAGALRRIDAAPPEAVPMLLEILEDSQSNRRHRYYALHLLRKVGPEAKVALPLLHELRDSADGRIRDFFDRAIRDIEDIEDLPTD